MAENKHLLERLCNLEVPDSVHVSPNGKQVLYHTSLAWGHMKGGVPESHLWLAESGVSNSAKKLDLGQFNTHAAAWHPDGKKIAFLSDRAEYGMKWAVYLLDVSDGGNGEPQAVTPKENKQFISMFKISPDGKSIAFLSTDEAEPKSDEPKVWGEDQPYARLRVVDLVTKNIRSLNLERHVVDLAWSSQSDQIAIVSGETAEVEDRYLNGTKMSVVDTKSLQIVRDLCTLPSDANCLTWANEGKIYFRAGVPIDKLFSDYGVYSLDPISSNGSYKHVAFGVDENAKAIKDVQGTPVVWLETRMQSRICRLDETELWAAKTDLQALMTIPWDVHFEGEKASVAVATSDINHPMEVWFQGSDEKSAVKLSNHGASFSSHKSSTCNFLTFPSFDKEVELDALYLKSSSAKDSPLPTVVLIHGGPPTRITNAFDPYYYMWVPYLLSLGYGILLPNYRGGSGRGQKFAQNIGGTGRKDYEDVIASVQHAIDIGYAEKERLVVGGYSHGGFLSLCCAVRNGLHGLGWNFKAAISGAAIAEADSMAFHEEVYFPELCEGRRIWNSHPSDIRNRQASPLWEVHSAWEQSQKTGKMIIPPVLILHGDNDQDVPLNQAWAMRRALSSKKLPFEMVTYPGQEHIMVEQKFWIDMGLRVGRWCEKHIGEGVK